ncbi:MAG: hypothetical protein AAGE52_23860 [Myxococcota bacterium]
MKRLLFLLALSAPAGTGAQPPPSDAPVFADEESVPEAGLLESEQALFENQNSGSADPIELEEIEEPDTIRVETNVRVQVTQQTPPEELNEEPATPKGTYFLAELYAGLNFHEGLGGAGHLLVGAGGRRAGGFLRFYLVGGLGVTTVAQDFRLGGVLQAREERRALDLMIGLRIYAPVFGPFRIFVEALTGGAYVGSNLLRSGDRWQGSDWSPLGHFAFGLQVRVLHQLSLGLRFGYRITRDPLQEFREGAGLGRGRTASMTAGATWHF